MISQRVLSLIAGLVVAAVACADYPEKPVRIVVGFTPGGGPDIIARHLAHERWLPNGIEPRPTTPAGFDQLLAEEIKVFTQIARGANIRAE
jgi:hypothetical protein